MDSRSSRLVASLVALALLALGLTVTSAPAATAADGDHVASGWTLIKFPQGQPACAGAGFIGALHYDRLDCGFGYVGVTGTDETSSVTVQFVGAGDEVLDTRETTYRAEESAWEFDVVPDTGAAWPAGVVTIRVSEVDGATGNFGETSFFLNQLGATVGVAGSGHAPGEPFDVTGTTYELDSVPPLAAPQEKAVGASLHLRVTWPDGTVKGPYGPFTADPLEGTFAATVPAEATEGLSAGPDSDFQVTVSVEAVDATYSDPVTGPWAAARAGSGSLTVSVPPTGLLLENSFVSSVGWVKPGETYPSRVFVRNYDDTASGPATVAVAPADGMTFSAATPTNGSGECRVSGGAVSWSVPSVPAATDAGPGTVTCVLEGAADPEASDSQIVWKNLSTTATLSYDGAPAGGVMSTSHGPKVIPADGAFDTARYGDRPFPVVPVDYSDRNHSGEHTGEALANKINSPGVEGSTFNLYQEMSLGQLYPNGTVPSAAIASAGWDGYEPGYDFTNVDPQGTCRGVTYEDVDGAIGSALHPERIRDGWYQMPGSTDYYGDDKTGSAVAGSVAGVGALMDIDSACGPTGKAVYDAAQIADPEIDYSDFDTDKDGVVDFFMMVYAGVGGNGVSQTSVPPYDNIWPHSSSLEFSYTDPDTGLKGYVSDDQLQDLQGRPLFWTDDGRSAKTTDDTGIPVFVRVGPYNVNPESSIDKASVISHEYGHSLGLPDFYSLGGRETYGTWNLMATDRSQHMDIFGKQEMGWIVPNVLDAGETVSVTDWQDSKLNTHQIEWVDAGGNPYTLSGPRVDNAEAYVAKLPARQIIDPARVEAGASPSHLWWSESGNDFGCAPQGGHNFDVYLPELADVPAGTPVSVEFQSYWDIEWDFDYGFVMASADGETYESLPSGQGYSTPASQNPNANGCQTQYGNGLTGTSGSYAAGTQDLDRVLGNYPDGGFVSDSYDLSEYAGQASVLRFSYSTDAGLARPGWFIDDLKVTAGDTVIYDSDFESGPAEDRLFNGGCQGSQSVAAQCTDGWQYVDSASGSPADHAYYLEMRDRSGFDLDGNGEDDRGNGPTFAGGLSLVYTDEAHGYGNVGTDNPPAQSPLDSQPEPGSDTPNLDDAAFTAATGDSSFSDSGAGWTDNYSDPSTDDGLWHFRHDCLDFDVTAMTGDGNGPADVPPYDLSGDVTFTMGQGCAAYDYGAGEPAGNAAPTAVAQAKPTEVRAGEEVTFDGSMSSDDAQAPNELAYSWDFGDGSPTASGQLVTHAYADAGTYEATLTVTDAEGATGTDTVSVTVTAAPDLQVTELTTTNNTGGGGKPRQGDKVTVTATVANTGAADAAASTTRFTLDDESVLGEVATEAIPAGESRQVSVGWDTRGVKGEHELAADADSTEVVAEGDETNNTGTLAVEVRGNKVRNGSFEQSGSGGAAPAAWSPDDTSAGTTSWTQEGSDGERAVAVHGNGGNATTAGSPTWTSDPVDVRPGEALVLRTDVRSTGASSAGAVGLALLDGTGGVLDTVSLLALPTATDGFESLERAVTVPPGVAAVRVVLTGFAATDGRTAGTVVFDDVGLYSR